ncbi:MAG: methyltransferase domain-containing protein [Candidatus Competibacter sp.]|nr:methyltransferase domain-containing protein [Candidatus Competibacter sp.]
MLHLRRVKWALRKSRLPAVDGLVLDVGSGGKPYPRSDILFDRLTGSEHRCGTSMMIDRPAVFGDATKLPFKDKSFDFVVASHILEHIANPGVFLDELQRVGKAGYIETPNIIFERLHPYDIHCLEVVSIDKVLHIYKKKQPIEDSFLGCLNFLQKDQMWKSFFFEKPDMFHVRYFWKEKIEYFIHNPEVSCEWVESINDNSEIGELKSSYLIGNPGWRGYGLKLLGTWYALQRRKRLKDWDLLSVLVCPECKGDLERDGGVLACRACDIRFSNDPHPNFTRR